MSELNDTQLDLIQKYLVDDINAEELKIFNVELKDSRFREKLIEQARNMDSLKDHVNNKLRSDLAKSPEHTKAVTKNILFEFQIIGLVILLFLVAFYFLGPKPKKQIYMASNYFAPYPPNSNIRGTEATKTFSDAMKYYANDDYEKAAKTFLIINPRSEEIELYLGCSYLKLKDFDNAYKTLDSISLDIDDVKIYQNIQWFKSIALLGLKREQEANLLLQEISKSANHLFKDKATQLLKELQ